MTWYQSQLHYWHFRLWCNSLSFAQSIFINSFFLLFIARLKFYIFFLFLHSTVSDFCRFSSYNISVFCSPCNFCSSCNSALAHCHFSFFVTPSLLPHLPNAPHTSLTYTPHSTAPSLPIPHSHTLHTYTL